MIAFLSMAAGIGGFAEEQGLVLHYDLAEGQGNTLKDKSGNGRDGVIFGAQWTKEQKGHSLFFDGIDDYVEVKGLPYLREEFTVELLVKPGKNPKKEGFGSYRLLIGKRGEFWDPNSSFALYLSEGGRSFAAYIRHGAKTDRQANEVYLLSSPMARVNAWQKVTLVKTKSDLKLFVDSVPAASVSTPQPMIPSTAPLVIGGVPTRFFEGYLKEVKLFNHAKKVEERSFRPRKERRAPYLVMVTSMDEKISSTPLLDVGDRTIELLNGSPFDGVAFNLMDIYSAQSLPGEKLALERAAALKAITKKDVWVRVNMNRMYQRAKGHSCYDGSWTKEDLAKLPPRGLSVEEARPKSTPYFAPIKVMDIHDEHGALSDFYGIWRLSLKFCKVTGSGIVLDLEDYGGSNVYRVAAIAAAHGKPVEAVAKRLEEIGALLADIAAEENPTVRIISLFTFLRDWHLDASLRVESLRPDGNGDAASVAHIMRGLLMRARERQVPLKLIEGGETDIGYVNRTLDALKTKIASRWFLYLPWLEKFPRHLSLGATITLWDDPSKISGWVKADAGDPNPFGSLNDFKPFLNELFSNYVYLWVYQPMCIDYTPYDPRIAPAFHQKLRDLIAETLKETP